MMDNGVPAAISNTAGTYVCNDLMYHLLYQLKHEFPNARGGFIHVPYATIQNHPNMASMTIEEMSKGLALCIEAAIENEHDITAASGATPVSYTHLLLSLFQKGFDFLNIILT